MLPLAVIVSWHSRRCGLLHDGCSELSSVRSEHGAEHTYYFAVAECCGRGSQYPRAYAKSKNACAWLMWRRDSWAIGQHIEVAMKRVKKSAPKQRSCRVLAMHVGAIVPFTSVGCLASRVRTCWASGAMSGKRTTRSKAKNGMLLVLDMLVRYSTIRLPLKCSHNSEE